MPQAAGPASTASATRDSTAGRPGADAAAPPPIAARPASASSAAAQASSAPMPYTPSQGASTASGPSTWV